MKVSTFKMLQIIINVFYRILVILQYLFIDCLKIKPDFFFIIIILFLCLFCFYEVKVTVTRKLVVDRRCV